MRFINGKTMYVLGAGASYHTGAPLLNDFLTEARFIIKQKKLTFLDSFNRVFDWIEKLRSPAYYLNIDLNNLEHVFSLASMLRSIRPLDGNTLYDDISLLMFETLEKCQIIWERGAYRPDSTYEMFVNRLDEIDRARSERTNAVTEPEKDVLVTFNYDVMLDFALLKKRVDYCLEKPLPSSYKLLKLHGSMNWGTHKDCTETEFRDKIQVVKPFPLPEGHQLVDPGGMRDGLVDFEMLTKTMSNTVCKGCGMKNTLMPVFIPPTWSKNPKQISSVWSQLQNS